MHKHNWTPALTAKGEKYCEGCSNFLVKRKGEWVVESSTDKFKLGDRVRLKKTKDIRRMFPKLIGVGAEVTGFARHPDSLRVKFDCHERPDTWAAEYFVKD